MDPKDGQSAWDERDDRWVEAGMVAARRGGEERWCPAVAMELSLDDSVLGHPSEHPCHTW